MKVTTEGQITGIRTLKDGTLSLSMAMQEMQPTTAASLFSLQNQLTKMYITTDNISDEQKDILDEWQVEHESKSPSKRMRNVLYRIWEQDHQGYEDFQLFYNYRMNQLIEKLKEKLT